MATLFLAVLTLIIVVCTSYELANNLSKLPYGRVGVNPNIVLCPILGTSSDRVCELDSIQIGTFEERSVTLYTASAFLLRIFDEFFYQIYVFNDVLLFSRDDSLTEGRCEG
jgi:hypothetical protein